MCQFNLAAVTQHKHLILIILLLLPFLACNNNQQPIPATEKTTASLLVKNIDSLINYGNGLLQDGDLLTRSDDDFESLSLQNFSKQDRTYSHSGIVFKEDSGFVVYHAMAGAENPTASLKRDLFENFVTPDKKTGFGIFRYQLSASEIAALHVLYKKYYAAKIPFDKSFNLKNDDSMYCSEIIYKALKKVTAGRIVLPVSTLTNFKPKVLSMRVKNVFFKKFEYIGLDDLYLNPFCKEIVRISYK